MRPVSEDLPDFSLVVDADILRNEITSCTSDNRRTYQTLRTPVDVRVIETRIAHGWSVDQGRNLSKVFGTELVESVDVDVLKLREELLKAPACQSIRAFALLFLCFKCRIESLTMYFSSGEVLDRNCSKERRK